MQTRMETGMPTRMRMRMRMDGDHDHRQSVNQSISSVGVGAKRQARQASRGSQEPREKGQAGRGEGIGRPLLFFAPPFLPAPAPTTDRCPVDRIASRLRLRLRLRLRPRSRSGQATAALRKESEERERERERANTVLAVLACMQEKQRSSAQYKPRSDTRQRDRKVPGHLLFCIRE